MLFHCRVVIQVRFCHLNLRHHCHLIVMHPHWYQAMEMALSIMIKIMIDDVRWTHQLPLLRPASSSMTQTPPPFTSIPILHHPYLFEGCGWVGSGSRRISNILAAISGHHIHHCHRFLKLACQNNGAKSATTQMPMKGVWIAPESWVGFVVFVLVANGNRPT